MSSGAVVLTSPLLASIDNQVAGKKKRLRHLGQLEIEKGSDDAGEWLRYMFKRASGPYVVVELLSDQVAQIYVRSAKKHERGKVLFRMEEIRLPRNIPRIVDVLLFTFQHAGYSLDSHESVQHKWRNISLEPLAK